MAKTEAQALAWINSVTNTRVTMPTNPWGGQCAAYVSAYLSFLTDGAKNLEYANAIDLLNLAASKGYKVEYFNGYNANWQFGDIWVSISPFHDYGHTGIFLEPGGGRPATSEQNVDGNADSLTNGGWVRTKRRLVYATKAFGYTDLAETQRLVGWIKSPITRAAASLPAPQKKKESEEEDLKFVRLVGGPHTITNNGGQYKINDKAVLLVNYGAKTIRWLVEEEYNVVKGLMTEHGKTLTDVNRRGLDVLIDTFGLTYSNGRSPK